MAEGDRGACRLIGRAGSAEGRAENGTATDEFIPSNEQATKLAET
jgi:hypothetical protein